MRDPDGIVKTHETDVHFQDTSVARRQEKSDEESDESKTRRKFLSIRVRF